MIQEIMEHNRKFVETKGYEKYRTGKYPQKKLAIVTCMDTRLVDLLPAALGLKGGDYKIIKNAGGTITDPFDSCMRSLLVATYELGVEEIMIIGHTNCGVQGMNAEEMLHLMKERGIEERDIQTMRNSGIDLDSWLTGFEDTADAVNKSVELVKNHPLMPKDVSVKGYVINTDTGELVPTE